MSVIEEILGNRILITGIIGWAVAQVLKTVLFAIITRKLDLTRLTGDGGMPSCHSATVTSVAVMTGLQCGFDSPYFAIAAILAIVVMHDAMGVRLETGKQAQVINEMFELLDRLSEESLSMDVKLKELVGHTPMQVVAGGVLGVVVAVCYDHVA
ncbi:MAG: divergent PAP2 family protein [Lachnospiraceae bacterium]|nr:divergent PAP2 family protein [Lachnospiraceae bacterium]